MAVTNGCDLNCGEVYKSLIAVAKGLIAEAAIDKAVTRLFTARFRLGMFDPPERVPCEHSHRGQRLGGAPCVGPPDGAGVDRVAQERRPSALAQDAQEDRRDRAQRRRSHCPVGQLQRFPIGLGDPARGDPAQGGRRRRGGLRQGSCGIRSKDTSGFAEAVAAGTPTWSLP